MSVADVVVAGHICLDIIPTFERQAAALDEIFQPGRLVEIGSAVVSTGGPVSNTGLALHRLGVPTRLMGKVGDDLFGRAILDVLRRHDPALAEGMIVAPHAVSSYTLVISPPGVDRLFLHCRGANETFADADVRDETLADARLFHFGYPPLMRRMYERDGAELEPLLQRVRRRGLGVSLDMCSVDPHSDAGRVDWPALLRRVLPHVDVFMPSLDEILYMLRRPASDARTAFDGAFLSTIAGELLALGTPVVGLKLGDQGLFVRTAAEPGRMSHLAAALGADLGGWAGREVWTPCFKVGVIGTTGSGDATIAGFLTGMLHGLSLESAMTAAVGVGACCVEAADATSGVPRWEIVQRRIASGWDRLERGIAWPGARSAAGLLFGPFDRPAR